MFTEASRNLMIAAEGTTHLSLHTAYSLTGANELSGGSPAYARMPVSYGAPSAGAKAQAANVILNVPAGPTVQFVGRWTALTGGTFLGMTALGGIEREFSVDLTTNLFTVAAHGYLDTNQVVFVGGTPPAPLVEGTIYFVRDATTDSFRVAATSGGAAIDVTTLPGDACLVSRIVPETYASQGTYQTNAGSVLGANI